METVLENPLAPVVVVFLLAGVVEAIVEFGIAPLFEPLRTSAEQGVVDWRVMGLRYVSLAISVLLAILYGADLLAVVGIQTPIPYVGNILTGLLMGRGSNFVHEFASRYLAKE